MISVDTIIGTGGIGTGKIYQLEGNESLGRNETRFARLLDRKDYCKLHIVFHYVAVLLGRLAPQVSVLPVGAVGDDPEGRELLEQMKEAGMTTTHVRTAAGSPTLTALCYQFPDGSGGNISERYSASSRVTSEDIDRALAEEEGKSGFAAALPEVPIDARLHLLRRAKAAGMKTAASFITSEMEEVRERDILEDVDIISLNIDEAAALSSIDGIDLSSSQSMERVVDVCFDYLSGKNSEAACIVTAGSGGFYAFHKGRTVRVPSLNVDCVNSAGAGDALMAGLIIAEVLGLPFMPLEGDSQPGTSALDLANCLAAMSVESPDTINFRVTPESFTAFCTAHGSTGVAAVLQKSSS